MKPALLGCLKPTAWGLAFVAVSALAPAAEPAGANTPPASGGARAFVETPSSARSESVAGSVPPDVVAPIIVPYGPSTPPTSQIVEFEQERLMREWLDQPMEPLTIYFPPAPPVLGAPLPGGGLYADDVARALAPYATEPFYAPLSTRLAEEDLGRRLRSRIDEYMAQKAALLAELRAQLALGRGVEAPARRRMLQALAAAQDPALAALERTADELRREFFRARFFGGGGDWGRYRAWHLEPADLDSARPEVRTRELRVLRAAVYFQEGMSPAQRRLLRELVMEQSAALHVPGGGIDLPAGEAGRVIYFSPDTARLPLPAGLPAELLERIDRYEAGKVELKDELRTRLVVLDADRNASRRVRALQDLAAEQNARLTGLEHRADEIRDELARLGITLAPPDPPALPGALEGRVAAYLREKNELQKVAQDRLSLALAEFDRKVPDAKAAQRATRRAAVVRTTVDAFHADHASQISALNTEAEAIRGALAQHAATQPAANTGKSIEALIAEFADAFKRQQLANLYSEYRTALLEPGLSPAQRRLLFDGAIADLKLPGAIRSAQVMPDETLNRP